MEDKKYVSYIRLSKQKVGETQYGFDSQRTIITGYIKDGIIVKEYSEYMSGTSKRKTNSKVYEAIEYCKKTGATLIVAKFDRLSRDVSFLQYVLNSKIDFICCDFPGTNELVLNILCSIASYEAKMIQSRIKSGLAEAKKRGVKLGCPDNLKKVNIEKRSLENKDRWDNNVNGRKATQMIKALWGKPVSEICATLNENGFRTAKDKVFTEVNVRNIYNNKLAPFMEGVHCVR